MFSHLTNKEITLMNKHRGMVRKVLESLYEAEVITRYQWVISDFDKSVQLAKLRSKYVLYIVIEASNDGTYFVIRATRYLGDKVLQVLIQNNLPIPNEASIRAYYSCYPTEEDLIVGVELALAFLGLVPEIKKRTKFEKDKEQIEREEAAKKEQDRIKPLLMRWEVLDAKNVVDRLNNQEWGNAIVPVSNGCPPHNKYFENLSWEYESSDSKDKFRLNVTLLLNSEIWISKQCLVGGCVSSDIRPRQYLVKLPSNLGHYLKLMVSKDLKR